MYLARTTDKGVTWQTHIKVIEHVGKMTADSAFEDKYYIEIDNSPTSPYHGNLYTPWKRVIDRDSPPKSSSHDPPITGSPGLLRYQ